MKIKLSAYWWCQISLWFTSVIISTIFYFSMPAFVAYNFYPAIFLFTSIGILLTHVMRLFIIKFKLLNLNVFKKIAYLIPLTIFFAVFNSTIVILINDIFNWNNLLFGARSFGSRVIIMSFSNFFFFANWNLFYFIYYFFETNRKHQIESIRFESELKIQQLENENTKLQLQKNIADISLTALRSQMSPHFIFNCLNSIKLYTTENNTQAASDYLTKFSRLIRLAMENSSKEKILLSAELDILRLYIEMEAMRFKEKLQYKINIEKDVETDYIELPPLLLQPYVENAIWHGLMPKEEGGRLDIDVAIDNDKSLLKITITDNGIGRAKSASIKSKTAAEHKSYGMKVTSERISLINQVYKTGADVTVCDLVDDNAKPVGTKVIIKIPV